MDWIQGERFIKVADYTFSPKEKVRDDYDSLPNTLDVALLKDGDIIYTHSMYVNALFDLLRQLSVKVVVITHNGDNNIIDDSILPDNVIKWYAQNVAVKNPRIESIPIGLENSRWSPQIRKKEKMIEKTRVARVYTNFVYMNHCIKTNLKEREILYTLFEHQPWVTSYRGKNGLFFDTYLDAIYRHKFMFSPEGNGMDCHRTWECLYMGTIPIEKRNINNQFYTDLPICFVDDWREVTLDFLGEELVRMRNTVWNWDKLTFKYWSNKIKNHA